MGTSPLAGGGGGPDAAAGAVADANGAVLADLDLSGWPLHVGATVTVAPRTAAVRAVRRLDFNLIMMIRFL